MQQVQRSEWGNTGGALHGTGTCKIILDLKIIYSSSLLYCILLLLHISVLYSFISYYYSYIPSIITVISLSPHYNIRKCYASHSLMKATVCASKGVPGATRHANTIHKLVRKYVQENHLRRRPHERKHSDPVFLHVYKNEHPLLVWHAVDRSSGLCIVTPVSGVRCFLHGDLR